MKGMFKLMAVLLLFATLSTISISCSDSAKQKEEAAAKQKEEEAARQKEVELQNEKDQRILKKSREAGREFASRDFESSWNKKVCGWEYSIEVVTSVMNQEKAKWIEDDEIIFRNCNKYYVSSDMLEKMVVEWRRGFNEGWDDMFEYLVNKRVRQ